MQTVSLHDAINNPARLAELRGTGLLDSPPEESFDRYTRLAARILGIPVSVVCLIDQDRQFFKSQAGMDGDLARDRQTPLSHSFCKHVVELAEPLVIEDARQNALVRDNPAVDEYGVIAYLGVPLILRGHTLGTLCAAHDQPHVWRADDVQTLRDLAGAVMTEIELRRLARELLEQYQQLHGLELQRDEMVQMLVHDLRNPLTSMLAGLDLVADSDDMDPLNRQALDIARRGGGTLLAMIGEVLDLSRSEAGRLQLRPRSTALPELLDTACLQVEHMARAAGVGLQRQYPANLPSLALDGDKMGRALVNLLANAIQHTPTGGMVLLSASLDAVHQIDISISDTGLGISSDDLPRIFDKFAGTGARRRLGASTGLGLPFCKMVIEAHGGQIRADSRPGHGSTFHVLLPVPTS